MAMGLLSDEELERQLKNSGNRPVVNIPLSRGRKEGDVNVPDSLRKVIAQDAIENGRQSALQLAESVGVSASSVSAYANGANGTRSYKQGNTELVDHNNQVKAKVSGKARHKLLLALREITPDKLKAAKLKDIAGVARDMSAIVRNMEPKTSTEDEGRVPKVSINIFAPQRRQESDYEVLQVVE